MSSNSTPTYATAAAIYHANGWSPLPLPRGEKHPPPPGTTGGGAPEVTADDVARWSIDHAAGNLALRLAATTVGIDVDIYSNGGDTLTAAEDDLGPLPATWSTSSRSDGSGIRLYRVPPGTRLLGKLGPGVDLIQATYRYAVAWPSIHPSGEVYRWISPAGDTVVAALPLRPDALPELPAAWVDRLSTARPAAEVELDAWLDAVPGDPSPRLLAALDEYRADLGTRGRPAMLAFTNALAHSLAMEPGMRSIVTAAREDFTRSREGKSDPTTATAGANFDRALVGAITSASARPWRPSGDRGTAVGTVAAPGTPTTAQGPDTAPGVAPDAVQDVAPATDPFAPDYDPLLDPMFAAVVPSNRFNPPHFPEIVDGWLTAGYSGVLVGHSGGGKSFVALDLAHSVGRGLPWGDLPTVQGRVLYVAGEGTYDFPDRYAAWLASRDLDDVEDPGVDLWPSDEYPLTDDVNRERFAAYVTARGYSLVILDTMAKLTADIDENTLAGMLRVQSVHRRIHRTSPRTAVLWVHHLNKSGEAFSGHQSLYNGVDFFWKLSGPHERLRLYRAKNKSGPDGDSLAFQLTEHGSSLAACAPARSVETLVDPLHAEAINALLAEYAYRHETGADIPGFKKTEAVQTLAHRMAKSRSFVYALFNDLHAARLIIPSVAPGDEVKTTTLWRVAGYSEWLSALPDEPLTLRRFAAPDPSGGDPDEPLSEHLLPAV